MDFAQVNGINIHYHIEGAANGMPLVFINSLGTDLRLWDAVVPAFASSFRIIRHDKRGHGLSECPPAPYAIRDHADDLAALLDFLKVPQAILIGISVGGMIALDFAAQHPKRVAALLLCDTAPKIGTVESWNTRIKAVRQGGMASIANLVMERWFLPAYKRTNYSQYVGFCTLLTRTPAEGYIGTCAALRDADLTDAARTITAKTLVLCGAEDIATPPEQSRRLTALIPASRYVEIPAAGHLPCAEQPDLFAQAILQFLKENGYAG